MKVLIASPEVFPFVKTGGLADVTGSLPKALKRIGVEARIVLPKHKMIDESAFPFRYRNLRFSVPMSQSAAEGEIVESEYDGITAYLVEKDDYFYRDYLYSTPDGDYLDNAERFSFFAKAIIETIKVTGFVPDVLHCNDWETALAPAFLRTLYGDDSGLESVATVLTIHNMGYQGLFWHYDWHLLNIGWEYFTPEYLEFFGQINYLKGGIAFSDVINTVSRKYSEEIQTEEFGYGLDGILRARKADLYGIVNGIDYDEWNPEKDHYLPAHYSAGDPAKKKACKAALQRAFNLPELPDTPLIATISRLADQKGFDLIADSLEEMLAQGTQYVILGTGERKYHELLAGLAKKFSASFSVRIAYDNRLAHLIEAGADMFLMPSKYEPCGLNQLYSLRYGTVPVVRGVGGLEDTIVDLTEHPETGTGFKFYDYSADALIESLARAIAVYRDAPRWAALVARCMASDFSWERSAGEYRELYERAVRKRESR